MLKQKARGTDNDDLYLKGCFFSLYLTQSRHSHLKTMTQWDGETSNFLSKLGFCIKCCVNISALQSEERDYAPVFISIMTVNITIPGSCHLFYLLEMASQTDTQGYKRLLRSREGDSM